MKRSKKLLALLLVLAAFIGATFLATKFNPENEETEEVTGTVIFSLDTEAVTGLSWDYSEPLSFTKEEDGWIYTDDAAFPLDSSYIDTMLSTLSLITSDKTIENPEDLDQYGLEIPICAITVTAGEEYTLSIGEETSMGGQRYFSTGDGNVYLVDSGILDSFSYGLYDVLAFEAIPSIDQPTGLTLSSAGQSYEITYQEHSGLTYSDEYVWFLGDDALDTELTASLLETVTDLAWVSCVDYNAADLAAYGLDDPAATVTVQYNDNEGTAASFSFQIGATSGSYSYARLPGSNMVYQIDASITDTLLYTTSAELQPDEVLLMDWDTVTSMDITLDGTSYTITRSTQTVTDDEGNESEETIYLLSGEEVEITSITNALDAMASTGYATGLTPERSEEIRFTFHRDSEAFPEVELVFYQYNSSACLTTLNGEATVLADRTAVVDLVESVNALVLE